MTEPAPVSLADRGAPRVDVFMSGTVFLDIVFTGMLSPPSSGHEVWTDGMGSSPGGVANLAVACSRLGLRTSLAAAFGGDVYGDFCWSTLADYEDIDLSYSRRFEGWHSPVTVSLAFDDDRAMVTHGHPAPVELEHMVATPPSARLCFFDIGSPRPAWVDGAIAHGARAFAGAGWDSTGRWDTGLLAEQLTGVHAFVANADEAMAYARADTPGAALEKLRDLAPFVVVTTGSGGAFAADATTGDTAWAPGVAVEALDPTGAGDVFIAALMFGTRENWGLLQRLRFANLCAALSVRHFGGAMAAPGWGEIAAWWSEARTGRTRRDYAFLEDVRPVGTPRAVSRAVPTVGLRQLPPLPTPPVHSSPGSKET